jgi:hypothetical protein
VKLDCFVAEPVIGPAERPDPLAHRNDEIWYWAFQPTDPTSNNSPS